MERERKESMKQSRATTLAIKALEAQIKRLTVNANLHDMYHAEAPMCVEASRQRQALREAIAQLRLPLEIKAAQKQQRQAAQQEELAL
jgi:hypothetical protein